MIPVGTLLHGEPLPLPEARPSSWTVDVVGVVLAIVTAGWVLVLEGFHGGSALAAVVLAAVATVVVSRRVAARWPWAVPLAVAVTPVALAVVPGRSVLGDGVVGYANASGALYLLAAAAAAMLALRACARWRRRLGAVAAVGWAAAVLLVRADAAAVFAGLLVLAVLVRRSAASRMVLVIGSAAATVALITVSVLGATYEPGPRTGTVDRVIDATMGHTRVVMWHQAVSAITAEPITGVDGFAENSPAVGDQAAFAHNELLQIAADTGVIEAVLVTLLLVWAFAYLWRSPLPPSALPATIALGAVAVQANIDFVLHFPPVVLALAGLVGTGAGLMATSSDGAAPPAARLGEPALTAGGGVLVALMLLVVADPLNPPHTVPNGAVWTEDPSGVRFPADGIVRSADEPHPLYRALTSEPGLTVAMWAATADLDQDGPARVVSSSIGTARRNLTVGQSDDALVVRLRTTQTDWNAVDEQVEVPEVFTDTRRHHLVVTHDGRELRVYVDGRLRDRAAGPSGSYATWNFTYPLLLGNEKEGDRPWRGHLEAAAFYDRSLSPAQVAEAFEAGPAGPGRGHDVAAVARYTFAEPGAGVVQDVSPAALGPAMTRPVRLPRDPDSFLSSLLDLGHTPSSEGRSAPVTLATALRAAAHFGVFAIPALLLARTAGTRWPLGRALVMAASGALLLGLVLSVYRYTQGGSSSVLNVAAAVLGATSGAGAWAIIRPRR